MRCSVVVVEMRIVIAKPGLDGHDRGAKVITRILRDAGHEVIYTGIRKTPEEITRIMIDEDAHALGLSSLSGAHQVLIPRICEKLKSSNMHDVVVFAGGIIPEHDHQILFDSGVRAIFGPGTHSNTITEFLSEVENRKLNKMPTGVGEDLGWRWC